MSRCGLKRDKFYNLSEKFDNTEGEATKSTLVRLNFGLTKSLYNGIDLEKS